MNELIDRTIDAYNAQVPKTESEYLGDDGLLYCSKCHTPTQTRIKHPFTKEERIVGCVCKCAMKRHEAAAERERQEEIERQRHICFSETNMASWNFANDDGKNEKITNAMKNYVKNFAEFKREGKGLLLHGTVGTGKTYYAACIAHALIDEGYTVTMTNFAKITNKLFGMKEGKQEYIDSLNKCSLLVIDDLGAERSTEFMQEMVFNIIDARYRSGLPFIITTNLLIDEIKKPQDIAYSRIYDRILERCFPVEVSGISRRRQNVKDTYFDVKEKLGL